jgi:hypothetical protein
MSMSEIMCGKRVEGGSPYAGPVSIADRQLPAFPALSAKPVETQAGASAPAAAASAPSDGAIPCGPCGGWIPAPSATAAGGGAAPAAKDKLPLPGTFPGLISLVRAYLDVIQCDKPTRQMVDLYLSLIEQRANGELMTLASWLRAFVETHPSYKDKRDSNLTADIIYDVTETAAQITAGTVAVPQLLGKLRTEPAWTDSKVQLKGGGDRVFDFNDKNVRTHHHRRGCARGVC